MSNMQLKKQQPERQKADVIEIQYIHVCWLSACHDLCWNKDFSYTLSLLTSIQNQQFYH